MNDNISDSENKERIKIEKSYNPVIIFPLYSSMSKEHQMKIFERS